MLSSDNERNLVKDVHCKAQSILLLGVATAWQIPLRGRGIRRFENPALGLTHELCNCVLQFFL